MQLEWKIGPQLSWQKRLDYTEVYEWLDIYVIETPILWVKFREFLWRIFQGSANLKILRLWVWKMPESLDAYARYINIFWDVLAHEIGQETTWKIYCKTDSGLQLIGNSNSGVLKLENKSYLSILVLKVNLKQTSLKVGGGWRSISISSSSLIHGFDISENYIVTSETVFSLNVTVFQQKNKIPFITGYSKNAVTSVCTSIRKISTWTKVLMVVVRNLFRLQAGITQFGSGAGDRTWPPPHFSSPQWHRELPQPLLLSTTAHIEQMPLKPTATKHCWSPTFVD